MIHKYCWLIVNALGNVKGRLLLNQPNPIFGRLLQSGSRRPVIFDQQNQMRHRVLIQLQCYGCG